MTEKLYTLLLPELILTVTAAVLFLMGAFSRPAGRKLAPVLALLAMLAACAVQFAGTSATGLTLRDSTNSIRIFDFASYIRLLAPGIGALLILLAWPTDAKASGNPAINYGPDAGEFFGLALLSMAGLLLTAAANDIILLFLALELVSVPTYVMVSISRPLAVAQEAGVKYFFLGAMAAALMLFGFSYLYGATGTLKLTQMLPQFHVGSQAVALGSWSLLAVLILIAGFAFKMAAVPLHFYVGDVYEGAATPVTAFLAFMPKAAGFVALIKLLFVLGGPAWAVPPLIAKLLWILAVFTMTVGNVLGLLQQNVKRVLAYSSVAHSGYMLAGIAALCGADPSIRIEGLAGVLFYLAAYGFMNTGAFAVLILLPALNPRPATSAETFEDLAGLGRRHIVLGLAMAICCFSLIGLPLTVGFPGKIFLIRPALSGGMIGLAIIIVINAAISAAYYLRIVGTLFLRGEPQPLPGDEPTAAPAPAGQKPTRHMPVALGASLAVAATLFFGIIPQATQILSTASRQGTSMEDSASILQPESSPQADHSAALANAENPTPPQAE